MPPEDPNVSRQPFKADKCLGHYENANLPGPRPGLQPNDQRKEPIGPALANLIRLQCLGTQAAQGLPS